MLLHGDGTNGAQNNTFLDSSTNNFTITRNGNTTQGTFSPYGSNWSNYFGGSSDYLSLSGNAALTFGTGDFCIEGWINPTSTSGEKAIIGNVLTNTTTTWVVEIYNNYLRIAQYSPILLTSSSTIPANTWTHFAITRSGTTLRLFLNGVLDNSTTNSTNFSDNSTGFRIGDVPYGAKFGGNISNVRLVKGTAVYTSAFTPSTTPLTAISGTSLLTCQSNRFIDNSTNAFAITVNGTPSVQRFSPFSPSAAYSTSVIGGSGYFDGSGDYLTVPDNAAWDLGSGDFTIESWVYPTASPNQPIIVGQWSNPYAWVLLLSNDGNRYLRALLFDGSFRDYISSTSLQLNAWNHCAFVRESNTVSLYLNGSRVFTTTYTGTVSTSSTAVSIGADTSGASPTQGYISNTRVVKGTALYSGTTYTVPTAPLTAVSNTQLLCNMTNGGIFDNAMMNNLETVGNAQISTSVVKFGTGSMAFDGSGDYLVSNPATSNLYAFGLGDFTIEGWIYLNSVADNQSLIDFRPSGTNGAYPLIYVSSTSLTYYVNSASRINGGAVATSTWYHFAVARSGTNTKMFLGGTQIGSTYTDSNSYLAGAGAPWIGIFRDGSGALNGYIDDLRITKGYARYTSNFTPPTAAFPNQ
jgi:hypothetical protein